MLASIVTLISVIIAEFLYFFIWICMCSVVFKIAKFNTHSNQKNGKWLKLVLAKYQPTQTAKISTC